MRALVTWEILENCHNLILATTTTNTTGKVLAILMMLKEDHAVNI